MFECEFQTFCENGNEEELKFVLLEMMVIVLHESAHYGVNTGHESVEATRRENFKEQGAEFERVFFGEKFSYQDKGGGDKLNLEDLRLYYENGLQDLSWGIEFLRFDIGSLDFKPSTSGQTGDPSLLIRSEPKPKDRR